MTTYQPFGGYLTAYTSAVQNVMKTIYDPQIIPTVLRAGEATKFFRPQAVAFPRGKSLVIRVSDAPSQTARYFGPAFLETSNVGPLLPNPAMSPTWNLWQVEHDDLMGLAAGVRYAFPTEAVWDNNDVATCAQMLSTQSAEDIAEAQERGLVTRQSGEVCKILAMTNSTAAYVAGTANHSLSNTTARLWLDTSGILLHQGARIDIVHKDQTYASSLRNVTVLGNGMDNPASGVYGYIDVSTTNCTTGASFRALGANITAATISAFVYMSGEFAGSKTPEAAPADTSGLHNIYGLQDWFKALSGSGKDAAGVIYNTTRTTLGNQWALPVVVDKTSSGADTVVTMSALDSLLMQLHHKRLDQDKVTNYALLAGPVMVEKLSKLTASANRRVDSAMAGQQPIVTNYGFDGIMIHHPSLGTPVAVQAVRGLKENAIYAVQPGVCDMLNLGPPGWFPWAPGIDWFNESYTSGAQGGLARTMVMRADRTYFCNSMIRAPLWNGILTGVKPA